ncbi:outer membrane protein transport protein [Yoonia sp.]|uniref:OmpP1/FadL family transporter n=1 Tax=Yoonia sp. TaxID=2212373 RepID=UPI0025F869ED|nr:outer membrane protein transport protein [Yoonia sp.]
MKHTLTAGAATLLLSTTIASAGGIDRSGNPYGVLFEDGNFAQIAFSSVTPDVSGDYPAMLLGGSTDNMAESYFNSGFALKYGITPQIDLALFINQPFGANANYTGGVYTGLAAEWSSTQVAALAKYKATESISVYGGIRAVQSKATIAIPPALTGGPEYTAIAETDTQVGYVVGAAYEMPAIALRVSLTYESAITHELNTPEASGGMVFQENATEIELPQSVALDFQSGIAKDTLLFGSIRWAEWSVWEVRPDGYAAANAGDRITGIDSDVTTYRIGLGRRINDALSVFGRVTYEADTGDEASRLAPTDGSTSIGIGGTYTMDAVKFTGGIEYAMLGDATDPSGVAFKDNTAIGIGLSIGYSF